ncbi:MAG TPA: hypothetical protein VM118_11730, partial [Acidobacteriota bacterium]|nr:hypothetical protein [Acidobacteriota bacterium]
MTCTTSHLPLRCMRNPAPLLILFLTSLLVAIPIEDSSAQDAELDAAGQLEIIDSVTSVLNHEYVFPDVAPQLEAHVRERYRSGAYQDVRSGKAFARALSRDLQSVNEDLHLRVYYYPDEYFDTELDQEPDAAELARRLRADQRDNFTFRRIEILPGNVGYLKF